MVFAAGLVIGLFAGGIVSIMLMSLMMMSKRCSERENYVGEA